MEPTEQSPEQHTPAPRRPHHIVDQPATVAACALDYNSSSGAAVRAAMAKQQTRTLRGTITTMLLAAVAAVALTACSSTTPAVKPTPSAAPAPTPEAEPATDAVDRLELTEAAVQMTWADSSEQSKTDMCNGIDLLGTDWAADQLRTGGGDSDLDWDYAAVLIAVECAAR